MTDTDTPGMPSLRTLTSVAAVAVSSLAVTSIVLPTLSQAEPDVPVDHFPGFTVNGLPENGQVLVGAATTSPYAAFESTVGGTTGVHRTYYQASQVDAAVATAAADIAAGRRPWISFKTPYSWEQMNAGAGDAWAAGLAAKLDALDGPVWVAIHHEPEGDGDPAQWVAMQQRLSPILKTADNVAYSIILMGWNQFYGSNPAHSMDTLWPGKEYIDILGFDPYNWYDTTNGGTGKKSYTWTELNDYYSKITAWLTKTGNQSVKWAVAETGYTDSAALVKQNTIAPNGKKVSTRGPGAQWFTRAYTDMQAQGGIALTYFNVAASVNGEPNDWTWPLSSDPKRSIFASVRAQSAADIAAAANPQNPTPTDTASPSPSDATPTSTPSSSASATPTPTPTPTPSLPAAPATPKSLTAKNVTTTSATLTWTTVDRAEVYRVFRNGQQIATTTDGTYTDSTLTDATTYKYYVDAKNSGGISPASATVTVTTPAITPVKHRATASTNSNTATPTVTIPTAVTSGDRLLLFVTTNTTTGVSAPAGWTPVGNATDTDMRSHVFTKVAAGKDAGAKVTVALGQQSKAALTVAAYQNAAAATPAVASSVEAATAVTGHTARATAGLPRGGVAVTYWADKSSATTGWTTPAAVSKRDTSVGTASGRITAVIGDHTTVSAVTATANAASAKAVMWTVTLTPAA